MDFNYSDRTKELQAQLLRFMDDHIYPAEARLDEELEANTKAGKRWTPLKTIEDLKPKARAQGLWNLFLPPTAGGVNAAHSGREFGLSNSDYAPLAEIMGRVPWSSEVFNCSAPDTGNMEVLFENVQVPAGKLLLGEGRGFGIAQGRLGPGRIHHCMRLVGLAERSLELMCKRASSRVAFGRTVAEQGVTRERIAEARCQIDMARLLTLKAAWMMDVAGNKTAKAEIAMIKVVAPNMACDVIDWAMQVHGGGGVSDDFPLAGFYAGARTLRFADGPDEVHRNAIAKLELGKYA